MVGENKVSSEHQRNGYAVRERRYGEFSRTLHLPQAVKINPSTAWTTLLIINLLERVQ